MRTPRVRTVLLLLGLGPLMLPAWLRPLWRRPLQRRLVSMAAGDTAKHTMTDEEKFFFDLNGFIHVRGALSQEEVHQLNEGIDTHRSEIRERTDTALRNTGAGGGVPEAGSPLAGDGQTGRRDLGGMLGWPKPHCLPWRQLLTHPRLLPYLTTLCGPGYRMDHLPLVVTSKKGSEGFHLHGGPLTEAGAFNPTLQYRCVNGEFYNSLLAMSVQLVDHAQGDGGFCVIRGSHKLNFPEHFYQPETRAGDVLFFSEATVHGAMAWTAEHERRIAIYRFAPATVAYGRSYSPQWPQEMLEDLTTAQPMERSKPFNKCSSGVLWLEASADATTTSPGSSPKSSDKAPAPADQVTGAEQRLQTAPESVGREHESILEQRHMELTQLVEAQGQEVCRCIDRRSEELFSRLEVLIHKQMQTQQELCSKFEAASLLRPAPPQIEPSPQPPSCGPTILEESVAPPGLVEEETTTVAVASRRWDEPSEETGNDDGSDGDSDAFSDESVHPTASTKLLDREDEEAYQAALKNPGTGVAQAFEKKIPRVLGWVSVSEHWQLRLHNFLNTAAVEGLCALVIFTNSVLIGVQTDYMAKRIGEEQPLVFTVVDAAYTATSWNRETRNGEGLQTDAI
eukprot:g2500.t1